MDRIPPTGVENYSYLQSVWENNNMQKFSDSFKWYNEKDIVLTCEYDSKTKIFTARQNKFRSFENMVLSYFQQSQPDCKIESNVTTGRQKKLIASV